MRLRDQFQSAAANNNLPLSLQNLGLYKAIERLAHSPHECDRISALQEIILMLAPDINRINTILRPLATDKDYTVRALTFHAMFTLSHKAQNSYLYAPEIKDALTNNKESTDLKRDIIREFITAIMKNQDINNITLTGQDVIEGIIHCTAADKTSDKFLRMGAVEAIEKLIKINPKLDVFDKQLRHTINTEQCFTVVTHAKNVLQSRKPNGILHHNIRIGFPKDDNMPFNHSAPLTHSQTNAVLISKFDTLKAVHDNILLYGFVEIGEETRRNVTILIEANTPLQDLDAIEHSLLTGQAITFANVIEIPKDSQDIFLYDYIASQPEEHQPGF